MSDKPEPPTACKEPPWAWLLKKIDDEQTAKVLRVLGKRKTQERA